MKLKSQLKMLLIKTTISIEGDHDSDNDKTTLFYFFIQIPGLSINLYTVKDIY